MGRYGLRHHLGIGQTSQLTPKVHDFPNDSKVYFQLFRRIPRGSCDWYWWIAYPDEFVFDYLDAHMGFPELDQNMG